MGDAEKQEGQKTVVAFITGLLIGGLLVWVFSSTPDGKVTTDTEKVTTEEATDSVKGTEDVSVSTDTKTESPVSENGSGSLKVSDQAAGNTVTLGKVTYPDTDGWIVVRDYADGVSGKILGASRYSTDAGLLPTTVSLLRSTVKGSTYQVMFYTENGDKKFSTVSDMMVEGGSTTFKAQ